MIDLPVKFKNIIWFLEGGGPLGSIIIMDLLFYTNVDWPFNFIYYKFFCKFIVIWMTLFS